MCWWQRLPGSACWEKEVYNSTTAHEGRELARILRSRGDKEVTSSLCYAKGRWANHTLRGPAPPEGSLPAAAFTLDVTSFGVL